MNAPRQGQHLTGFLPKETNWPGKKLPGHFFVPVDPCVVPIGYADKAGSAATTRSGHHRKLQLHFETH